MNGWQLRGHSVVVEAADFLHMLWRGDDEHLVDALQVEQPTESAQLVKSIAQL